MGKRLIQQARGRGGPAYRAKSFNYAGELKHRSVTSELVSGTVLDIMTSAGHSAPVIKIKYEDGVLSLLPAPEFIRVGDVVQSGPGSTINAGNIVSLKDIPEGTPIYNIESQPGDGGKFCRTSGSSARLISKSDKHVTILLPSKKEKVFHNTCRACIGVVAAGGRREKPLLKAGAQHYKKRATNKHWPNPSASSQNAVDHPFGNTRSSRKARQKAASRHAPPGRKVGSLWPKRVGKKK